MIDEVEKMCALRVDEIEVVLVKPKDGLLGFASCVIEKQLYLGNIALHNSPTSADKYRLVFPAKKLLTGRTLQFFYPINSDFYRQIKSAIVNHYEKIIKE